MEASNIVEHDDASKLAKKMAVQLKMRSSAFNRPIEFEHTTIDGKRISQDTMAGRVVVVYYWSMKDKESNGVTEALAPILREVHDRGVEIISFNVDLDFESACRRLLEKNPDWNVVGGQSDKNSLMRKFPVSSLPHIMIVGRDGKVKYPYVSVEEIQTRLEELSDEPIKQQP